MVVKGAVALLEGRGDVELEKGVYPYVWRRWLCCRAFLDVVCRDVVGWQIICMSLWQMCWTCNLYI